MRAPPALVCCVLLVAAVSARAEEAAPVTANTITPAKPLVVVLNLETSGGVESSDAELVAGLVSKALTRGEHLEVVSADDIRRLADLEAQKQALGCDQSSCLAEIAGALGARYVVFGRMGKLGDVLLVQLNLFDAEEARAIAREDLRVASLSEVPAAIDPAVRRLAGPLLPEDARAAASEPPPPGSGGGLLSTTLLVTGGVVAGLGAAALLVGGVGALWANSVVEDVTAGAQDRNAAKAAGAGLVIASSVGAGVAVLGGALVGLSFVEWE